MSISKADLWVLSRAMVMLAGGQRHFQAEGLFAPEVSTTPRTRSGLAVVGFAEHAPGPSGCTFACGCMHMGEHNSQAAGTEYLICGFFTFMKMKFHPVPY